MKIRHNKKRNTAFIYESLIKEATAAILKNDKKTQNKVVAILKKHFSEGSPLRMHLECYRSLYESTNLEPSTAEKILKEAKLASRLLDTQGLFVSQSDLIKDVNKEFSNEFYNTFVPNYKTLASIAQVFSHKTSPKNSVILENQILTHMTRPNETTESQSENATPLVVNTFVNKFNDKYDNGLLEEQKTLLNYYISSFSDNSLSLKTFLNDEIPRLKVALNEALTLAEIKEDAEMGRKTKEVISKLESFYNESLNEKVLLTILKTQQLVKELATDGDHR